MKRIAIILGSLLLLLVLPMVASGKQPDSTTTTTQVTTTTIKDNNSGGNEETGPETVTVCHYPPNDENTAANILTIPLAALEGHLGHGDFVIDDGQACPPVTEETSPTTTTTGEGSVVIIDVTTTTLPYDSVPETTLPFDVAEPVPTTPEGATELPFTGVDTVLYGLLAAALVAGGLALVSRDRNKMA